ncbi:TonB-dependent receptor [Sphingomonas sp. G-3-2-10]|uniref:TonB-dependent receptor n=1 Tax=Sphingomonas sp. G-3-2-10 TaxID=2728838 RepID=UPI00146ADCDB|nr:TonB-dependent receptor [Sphingomonas sp. G-3-2-10]NML08413.1 TonB-dependent receptor [Sphingomonas sp. G-3-2-10]
MRKIEQFMLAGVASMALMTPAQSWAQQAQDQDPAAEQDGNRLEEIVVTARRREEGLQKTPISVSAISEEGLEQSNIQQIDKVSQLVPNVALTATPSFLGGNTAFIRGIGAQDPSLALDTPVATYIDGVLIARNLSSNLDLVNVERIEVLRGPQGTLFGRNTTGGAISITTKKPSRDFGFEQKFGIASFGEWSSRTLLETGELGGSGIAASVAYIHRERNGYVDNPFAPGSMDPGAINSEAVMAKIRGEWGSVRATYSYDYNHMVGVPAAFQFRYASPAVTNYFGTQTTGNRQVITPAYQSTLGLRPLEQEITIQGHSFILEADLDDHLTIKSITGYRDYDALMTTAYSPPGIFGPTGTAGTIREVFVYQANAKHEYASSFSQELQLLGTYEGFNFVGGLFYFEEDGGEVNPSQYIFVSSAFAGPTNPLGGNLLSSLAAYDVKTKSYAAFAQASWRPGGPDGKLEITAGVRYTKDDKSAVQTAAIARTGSDEFSNFSYQATVSYQWTPDVMTYAKFGTGYRSGGFNVRASAAGQRFDFPAERATAGEIGLKSELFDRRVRLNASLWYTDYKDLQTTVYTNNAGGAASGFTNPAKATFQGFEAEFTAIPVNHLTLSASVGYTDADYQEIFFPAPVTGVVTNYASISHFVYVPKWTGNASIQYEIPATPIGDMNFRVDYSVMSRRWFHQNNLPNLNPFNDQISSPAHYNLDARFTLSDIPVGLGKTSLSLSAYVENLTNRHYPVSGIDFGALGFAGNVYNMPRRFGLDLKFKY